MSRPTISNISFDEMFQRMAQCGYRHVVRVREELTALKAAIPSTITAHIAQVNGQPPFFLVKSNLLLPADLRGQPQIEFVVTVTQTFPNSYPIITIEGPPEGWTFKRHNNVDNNGCCYLNSVSSWDPRRSNILNCVRELQQAFCANHPFQPVGGARTQAPPAVAATPVQGSPAQQQSPATSTPPPLGAPRQPPMPQQTIAMGQVIFGATNAASSRTDAEMMRQRERDQVALAEFQRRQQADPANRGFATSVANFNAVIASGSPGPAAVVSCPLGFGVQRFVTAPDPSHPLRSADGCIPPPLPPCLDPTPDEQYKQAEQQRLADRTQREAQAQSQPKSTSTFGSLSRALNIGAAAMSNMASKAASSVESEMRKSEAASERKRFQLFFPQFASEELFAEYPCWSLMGSGLGVQGLAYITSVGLHFTTKKPDNLPVKINFNFDISFNQIASLVKGTVAGFEWIHLMYDDLQFRSLYNVTTSTAASIGEFVSTSIVGTPYGRMYNWLDHKWRPMRFGQSGPRPMQPPPPSNPAHAVIPQGPTGASQSGSVDGDQQCVVCMERPKNQFFQPCGHVCCCQVCREGLRQCPLCRAEIQQSFQAFL